MPATLLLGGAERHRGSLGQSRHRQRQDQGARADGREKGEEHALAAAGTRGLFAPDDSGGGKVFYFMPGSGPYWVDATLSARLDVISKREMRRGPAT